MKRPLSYRFGDCAGDRPVAVADDCRTARGWLRFCARCPRHAQLMTLTISIDYDKQLVNGITASFSPSMIVWTVANGSKSEHHELNRITGTIHTGRKRNTGGRPADLQLRKSAPRNFEHYGTSRVLFPMAGP